LGIGRAVAGGQGADQRCLIIWKCRLHECRSLLGREDREIEDNGKPVGSYSGMRAMSVA
jgi:hypothetical protein